MYEYILFVLYIQITLEWPCMTSRIGRRFKQFMDSDSGTSKTYSCIFFIFFRRLFLYLTYKFPTNDLEWPLGGVVGSNELRIRIRGPQKHIHEFFGIFSKVFFPLDLEMTLNLMWWSLTNPLIVISDPKNLLGPVRFQSILLDQMLTCVIYYIMSLGIQWRSQAKQ